MDSPYLPGITMRQSGVIKQPLNDRRSPNEYDNDWYRFDEDKFQPGKLRQARQDRESR